MGVPPNTVKPTDDEVMRPRQPGQQRPSDDRWRRAMTRRDRPADAERVIGDIDAFDLPSSWCRCTATNDEFEFVREGRGLRLIAKVGDGGNWRVSARQRTGETEHQWCVGGAATRAEALRCLYDAMERINAALAETDWNGRICVSEVLDGVCDRDPATVDHIVQ